MFRLLLGLVCVAGAPLMAKEIAAHGQIYSHGTIRQAPPSFEAVVEVAAELLPNLHEGQVVFMDVRQGQLRGVVKGVRSPWEITIALDAKLSKVQLARLHHGQAVIAIIHLEPECHCALPAWN